MIKEKWIAPVLTVLARENPEKHVLVSAVSDDAAKGRSPSTAKAGPDIICALSKDTAVRVIGGEIMIVPATAKGGVECDALCTLNETGRAVWECLDGSRRLKDIAERLSERYDAPLPDIGRDIEEFAQDLLRRRLIAEAV